MLKLRAEQFAVFEQSANHDFFREMVEHFAQYSPDHSKRIGQDAIEAAVKYGLERCEAHGFSRRGPAKLYIELMTFFGTFFDEDPQYVWASEIICSGDEADQIDRADLLYKRVLHYLDVVYGDDNAILQRVIAHLMKLKQEISIGRNPVAPNQLLTELQHYHPERVEYSGIEIFRGLLDDVDNCMGEFNLQSDRMKSLIFFLMIGFGYRFYDDPQFSWIGRERMTAKGDRLAHEKRLENRVMAYLDSAMANFGRAPHSIS